MPKRLIIPDESGASLPPGSLAARLQAAAEQDPSDGPAPEVDQPERTCKWLWRSGDRRYGILSITTGKSDSIYFTRRLSNFVFTLSKLEANRATEYTTMIGTQAHCGCEGYVRHKECRHVSCLTMLHELGKS